MEKVCVVAGVVSHPDKQWLSLNEQLSALADEMVPAEDRKGIVFHAKDIWHGTKKFHRDKWPREKRIRLLEILADMPMKHAVPVIMGAWSKDDSDWPNAKPAELQAHHYSVAFGICVVTFEYVLRSFCGDELGMVIAEDVPSMRRHAKMGYDILRDVEKQWPAVHGVRNYMPLSRVVEQPLFAEKRDSGILQIADVAGFFCSIILAGDQIE